MADRIDKFFRNKISREEIPFDEDLWMQASAELDARNRKRRLIFWIIPIGLGLAGFLFWNLKYSGDANEKATIHSNEIAVSSAESSKILNDRAELESEQESGESTDFHLTDTDTQANYSTNEGRPSQKPIKSEGIKSPSKQISNQLGNMTIEANDFKTEKSNNFLKIESTKIQEENDAFDKNSASFSSSPANPLPFRAFDLAYLRANQKEAASDELPIIPSPLYKGTVFSGFIGSAYGFGDGTNSFFAYQAGLSYEKHLSLKWSLGLSLVYHFRNGSFGKLDQSLQKSYGFGSESNLQSLELNGIHAIELPLFVSRRWNRNSLSAGFITRKIIGFSGQKETQRSNDNLPFARVESSNGKINNTNLQPGFEYGLSLQYGYYWKGFKLGINGKSMLNPFSWTDSEGMVRNTAPYSLGLFAQYRLK